MDTETLMQYAPKVVVTLCGLAFVYILLRYKRRNDIPAWLRVIYARMERASKNEPFRQSELADANAEIAKYPVPNPIAPITNKQQVRLAAYPKMLFMSGLTGVVFIYLGLFETGPAGTFWPVYAGWGFIAVTALLYWTSEKARPYYRRVQQLNRKYLLQKAGMDPERGDTLREILEYYPTMAPLWMELADQYAMDKRYDEAVAAIRKGHELLPEDMDYVLIEASFHLRREDGDAMAVALNAAEKLRKVASDPRVAVYRGALALLRGEKKASLRYGKEAMELDADFTEKLVKKDEGLKALAEQWDELFQKEENNLLEAVAARQEARKTQE